MWRTACLSLLAALLAYGAGAWLTMDFDIWTAEGARRLQVARSPVPAPGIVLHGPGIGPTPLPALLGTEGGVTIVDFVYTRCQTVCLALGSTFQQLQADLRAGEREGVAQAPRVRLLSISFDPAHDAPSVLSSYAGRLRADPRFWRFATPVQASAMRMLLERFEVVVISDGMGGYEHNAALLVVDAGGRLVRIFDYAEMETALAYARHLAAQEAHEAPQTRKAAG